MTSVEENKFSFHMFNSLIILLICIGFVLKKLTNNKVAIFYTIFTILFILISAFVFVNIVKKNYINQSPILHEKLYNIMEYFDKFCQKHDIKYWAVAGTAWV